MAGTLKPTFTACSALSVRSIFRYAWTHSAWLHRRHKQNEHIEHYTSVPVHRFVALMVCRMLDRSTYSSSVLPAWHVLSTSPYWPSRMYTMPATTNTWGFLLQAGSASHSLKVSSTDSWSGRTTHLRSPSGCVALAGPACRELRLMQCRLKICTRLACLLPYQPCHW